MHYKIHYTNFGYWAEAQFAAIAEALAYAKSKGFEAGIYEDRGRDYRGETLGRIVASWSPLYGTRTYA